jgi:hypothetical protein
MALNESPAQPLGVVTLTATFQDERTSTSRRTVPVVVPCLSVYNLILGRMTLTSLGVVPSIVHPKMKYHD